MKPESDLIIILARDWGMQTNLLDLAQVKGLTIPTAWICGWFIEESKDSLKLCHEVFTDSGELEFRYISTIPKETIIFKKIISKEKLIKWEMEK